MKKWILFPNCLLVVALISILRMGSTGSSQMQPIFSDYPSTKNPAAVYCVDLGYDFEIAESPDGGQHGICILPDETTCDAWDFLNGKCGQDHSVCALRGLETVILTDGQNPFSQEYAVCADSEGNLLESVTNIADLVGKSKSGEINDPLGEFLGPPEAPLDSKPRDAAPPSSFDWRTHSGSDWMTPVRDQGICGSCWAFSAVGVTEGDINIASNDPDLDLNLSEQYLVTDCSDAGACDGGGKGSALSYIRDYGIPDEACLPYHDGDPNGCTYTDDICDASICTYHTGGECSDYRCSDRCSDWASRLHTIDSRTYMGSYPSKDTMKQALIDHGPLAVSMNMGGSFTGGIYYCPSNEDTGHAVVVVGYNDSGDYWIVRNSWGDTWGPADNGYFNVAYDNCAVQKYPYYADASAVSIVGPLVYDSHTIDDNNSGDSSGNDDGIVNPGETIEMDVTLYNAGDETATGVNVSISEDTPYVDGFLHNADSSYPDIPGGGTGVNSDDFDFEVDNSTPDGHVINFTLTINASNGGPWTDSFQVHVTDTAEEEVIVTIEDGDGPPGSTGNPVTVSADNQSYNTTPIASAEMWVVYDETIGVTASGVNTTSRTQDFQAQIVVDNSNPSAAVAHILLFDSSGGTIQPGTGPIVELLFDVDASANGGDTTNLTFDNVLLADAIGSPIPVDFTDVGLFTVTSPCEPEGDINGDGEVNIFDLQILINMILHTPQPDPDLYPAQWWVCADISPSSGGDGQWNVFDLQRLICLILGTCGGGQSGESVGLLDSSNVVSMPYLDVGLGTGGAFGIDLDNDDEIYAVEMWFNYDSLGGLVDIGSIATTSRTSAWQVSSTKDDSNPSAVEYHIILFDLSGVPITPGVGAILSAKHTIAPGATGSTPLDITQVNLADASGQPLSVTWQEVEIATTR